MAFKNSCGEPGAGTGNVEDVPSRRVAALWNLLFSHGTTVLILIKTLVFVPWYLHCIPFKEYGAWLASGGVLSFLTAMDLGLTGVLTQQSAVVYGAKDREKLGGLIGTGLVISAILAAASGLISAAVCPFIPGLVHTHGELASRLRTCILIAALANSLNIIGFAFAGVLKSLQRTFLPGLVLVASEVVNVLVIIGCLLAGLGLYSIAIGLLSRAVSLAIADGAGCWLLCRRRLALHLRWVGGEARQLWHLSVNVFVSRIATGLAMATDDFFIGVLIGPEAAGIFSITTRAHNMVRSLAGPFGDALMPSMAHLHGEGEHVRFAEVFATALKVQAAIAAIGLAGVAAFDRSFINLWVGPEIFAGNAVNITFSIWSIGYMVSGVIWQTLYSMGHIIKLCRIVWVETAVKVLASLSLIKATGILGAPVSALAAQAITMCMLLPLMIRTIEFARGDYFKLLKNIFFRLSLPAGIAVAVSLYAGSPQSWSHFVLTVGVYALLASSIFAFVDRKMIHLLPGKSKRSQIKTVSA